MMRQNRWSAFSFGPWLAEAVARMPRSKAAVALANKLARTARSLLRHGTRIDAPRDMAMRSFCQGDFATVDDSVVYHLA